MNIKISSISLGLFSALILSACSNTSKIASTPAVTSTGTPIENVSSEDFLAQGLIRYHEREDESLTHTQQGTSIQWIPCGSSYTVPVQLSPKNETTLKKQLETLKENQDKAYRANAYAHFNVNDGQQGLSIMISNIDSLEAFQQDESQCISLAQSEESSKSDLYVGQYQSIAPAASAAHVKTTLDLNPDHSATTLYEYDGKEKSIVETGFWQLGAKNQVTVYMVTHNERNFLSIRRYDYQDEQLTTHKESINGHTYSLGELGVQLSRISLSSTK